MPEPVWVYWLVVAIASGRVVLALVNAVYDVDRWRRPGARRQ